jgi:hypothetical protein
LAQSSQARPEARGLGTGSDHLIEKRSLYEVQESLALVLHLDD